VALADLIARDSALLASGAPISVLNRERATLSTLKGGGLATLLGARPTTVFYISDVTGLEGDGDAAVVGSGPCHDGRPSMPHRRVADNAQARAAAMAWAAHRRLPAIDHGLIAGDATVVGVQIAASLRDAPAGLHLWGGECTVVLPANPGRGGRCQQLALAAAPAIAGRELALLAVGSDGRDGPGTAAGALVDGGSAAGIVEAGFAIEDALARCDAGRALAAAGDLIDTAATGTNVADLVFGWAGRA
jgi:hydroxypyruvate reductase